ncbi:BatD family protein [Flavobacterium sp.]|uniref:BatD family protein n=1 Tax=Flavobacterium sp. TaxID=239 RepID=UPI0026364FCA|nr:BatD family protein [Flavobacterium sp.]
MKRIVTLVLLWISLTVSAQVKFEADVSKATVAVNERFRVEFTMNVDGDNFEAPDFEESGFSVFSGPSQNIREIWMNGKGIFHKTYTYFLIAEKKGTFTIKPAAIEFNNRIYRSNTVKVTVTPAVDPANDPNSAPVARNSPMYLVTEVSNSNPYVNEPITVVQKLYFNYNTDINDARDIQKPRFNDFWSQEIETDNFEPEQTVYKGKRCLSVVLKKAVLYPQKSGSLEIDPYILEVDCRVPTGRMSIFGEIITMDDSRRLTSSGKTITVKALPETNKPEKFSGAVGDFSFTVVPSKTTLKFGESLDMTLKVSGQGNLKLFQIPRLELPENWEVYDPEHVENVTTPLSGMTGSIADRYTVVPQAKGAYVLKDLRFSYFDLRSKQYRTISSPPITITVTDGPGLPAGGYASNARQKTEREAFVTSPKEGALSPVDRQDFLGSPLFYSLLLMPFLAIPLFVFVRRRKAAADADTLGKSIRMKKALVKRYLSEAGTYLQSKGPFYDALERALHNFLKAKLLLETTEMQKETIRELLVQRKADSTTVAEFIQLLESCEMARFAPSSATAIQNDYDTAIRLITELEKQLS